MIGGGAPKRSGRRRPPESAQEEAVPVTEETREIAAPLDEIEVLSQAECDDIRERIHSLREHWISRRPDVPFFTLGTASYLDAPNGRAAQYREGAQRTNPVLAAHFADLYETFRGKLSDQLGAPCRFEDDLAYPGFHVFGYHPLFLKPLASVHFDMQYLSIDWSAHGGIDGGPLDFDRQVSITLSIRLPKGGGGLRVWNINQLELRRMTAQEAAAVKQANAEPEYHPYRAGAMVLHSGHQLHQIAPAPSLSEGDERITLQAHAVPDERGWIVYW
jgi:hypothetical protein